MAELVSRSSLGIAPNCLLLVADRNGLVDVATRDTTNWTEGLGFDYRISQIERSVANGKLQLQHSRDPLGIEGPKKNTIA